MHVMHEEHIMHRSGAQQTQCPISQISLNPRNASNYSSEINNNYVNRSEKVSECSLSENKLCFAFIELLSFQFHTRNHLWNHSQQKKKYHMRKWKKRKRTKSGIAIICTDLLLPIFCIQRYCGVVDGDVLSGMRIIIICAHRTLRSQHVVRIRVRV